MTTPLFTKLPPRSFLACIVLAFVAMTGLAYINFLPGVVNALALNLGFSEAEAGQLVASNGYGGLLGSGLAIFLVRTLRWRPAMAGFLAVLALLDAGTLWVEGYGLMLIWRFAAGVAGGLCVGLGFAVLARLHNPDRAFGTLLFIQFSIGSLVIALLPTLEAMLGGAAVFQLMAALALLSLLLMGVLPEFKPQTASTDRRSVTGSRSKALLLMLAILSYQVAASGIWAYVGLIGIEAGLDSEAVSLYIATTGLTGLLGALLPMLSAGRTGRLPRVLAGVVLSILAALLLSLPQLSTPLYITAMALLFFSWPAVQAWLLAVTAELDGSGQLATVAAVMASVGLASGPLLAASLLEPGDYSTMLQGCALIFVASLVLLIRPVRAQAQPAVPST